MLKWYPIETKLPEMMDCFPIKRSKYVLVYTESTEIFMAYCDKYGMILI
jgi:hypothetical protein